MIEEITGLPKVVLHDHLDGGLRPATVLSLAAAAGYRGLPESDAAALGRWFHQAGSSSLEAYLQAFMHTFGVMQTPEAMRRVALEAVEDMAGAGVVYAEIRFAPSLHMAGKMTRQHAIAAVVDGLAEAEERFGVPSRVIVDAMRQDEDSAAVAAAAGEFVGAGVVGFDLAGPEAGYPARRHQRAIDKARESGLRITIHAGEGDGVGSIADALASGAERIGHGVRIIEDTTVQGGRIVAMGPVAAEVHSRRIPLEVTLVSNLDTGMYPTAADHPVGLLHRAGFVVTLSTDNRLMSATSMVREFTTVLDHCGIGIADLAAMTRNAVAAAFCDEATRARVSQRVEAGNR
ncbi:MAG: adenosine deaminase [Actinobacteria bacterium RBG_16_67_15]|nr:MAG: adenosine deaminase [Actinobacteria bacterium RBG_16_67_15]